MITRRYEVGPGTATLLVRPGLVLLVCDEAVPPMLQAAVDGAQAAPGGWQELGRELGELLGDGARLPAFGVVAELEGGTLVFLAGAVVATLTEVDGGTRRLSGVEAATWIDRLLAADQPAITLAPEGHPVPMGRSTHHLVEGIVPAGWVRSVDPAAVVATSPASAPSWPTPPSPPAAASGSGAAAPPAPVDRTAAVTDGPPPPPVPAPAATEEHAPAPAPPPVPAAALAATGRATMAAPRTPAGADDGAITVEGILCVRDHLNAPDAAACWACGAALDEGPQQRVERARPSLGFLVLDDGATYALDGPYVLGREPGEDPSVVAGQGRPITLDDPQRSVSRVHAEVRLVGWDVQLLDRGSTNGTYVLRGEDWEAVARDEPRLIGPGTRMAVGQRTFVYEPPCPV